MTLHRLQHQYVDEPDLPARRPVQSGSGAAAGRARRDSEGRRDRRRRCKIPVVSVWPGSDGADYHFQIDYLQSLEWFTEALVKVNRACVTAGIKLAIEPKPYEPRELYMIVPTAASAAIRGASGQRDLRRQQLRPDDRLRPSEDGGDDGVHGVRPGGVRGRADPQVRHQRRAPGPERSGPDLRHDLDSRVGRLPVHDVRARLPRLLQPGSVHVPGRSHARDGTQHDQLREPVAEGRAASTRARTSSTRRGPPAPGRTCSTSSARSSLG